MSTTIDSLAIEIQTNSSGAIADIERLADALDQIKKSTVTKTAVNNLKSLTTALKELTPVSSNANKLSALAKSLGEISAVGSIRGITNQLKELPVALKGLAGIKLDGVAPQIERLAVALGPLSNIKGKGFNDTMTGLQKLDDVAQKLDSGSINRFAARIKELDDKLGPVSKKLVAIGNAFKGVNASAKTAGGGLSTFRTNINATALNITSFVSIAQSAVSALQPIIRMLSYSIGEAVSWDGIEYQFGNAFGEQADMYYEKITEISDALRINKQMFMENSAMAASMLKGFGVAATDAREMGLGYTELAYDIWAAYNNVYKTLDGADGAMAAIRSAIAGEVEPIRRAGFTIVESQLEITAANYGIAYSSEKATEAQKSYLRYLTLVEQAHTKGIIGTFASEMDTAEGQIRTLKQQLKTLAQTFGSIFLPVLVEIMPWLTAFVELLGEATIAVANFFGIDIQRVDFSDSFDGIVDGTEEATGGVKETTKALKELKNATIGIDELNVISPPTQSGNSGGASDGPSGWDGLDVESIWDKSIFDQVNGQVDEIKEKLKGWLPIIEAVGLALGGLAITKLLSSIGDALLKMDTLSKAIAGVSIATIEAVLTFLFADNYLEEGKLTSLIGEAVATALGSYLLYKTWGDKGLVAGIAVSIAAQLAAITLNLADGGVEMDDPELWIQSVFTTALGGAAGGWLSYKGIIKGLSVGKGIGFGLLAVASLTLAAITIGEITAKGELTKASIVTGIGSIAAAAGFGFMVGGPWGAAIGAAVGLTLNVAGALIGTVSKNAEKSVKEELESRFGKVELSASEISVIIGKLTPKWAEGVDQAAELYKGVEELIESIGAKEGALGSLEWQVGVGLVLTEDENQQYRQAIDSFVIACQNYVTERGYALDIGLKATTTNNSIIESANSISAMVSGEMESLGKKLQDAVNDAYADGLLEVDELEVIQTVRRQMLEITEALSSGEVDAVVSKLTMKWSGVELSADSFSSMLTEWNDVVQNTIKPALETTVDKNLENLHGNIAALELMLKKETDPIKRESINAELQTAREALQNYIDENPLQNLKIDANIEAVNFALNTLRDAYAEEIARVESEGLLDFEDTLSFVLNVFPDVKFDEGNGDVYGNIQAFLGQMQYEFQKASESMPGEARKALEAMLKEMKPTMADYEELAAENRKLGLAVPQSVRDGLNDYNELRALSGDLDGINYMIGQGFTTDPTFLNTLATMEGAGTQLVGSMRDGFLNNVEYVRDEASGLIIGIKDTVNNQTVLMTPYMEKSLADLGVNMGDALGSEYQYIYDETTGALQAIVDSSTNSTVWGEIKKQAKTGGKNMADGVKEGADAGMSANKKHWLEWAIWPWNWFKKKNEINSPSKLFERGGKYLTDGLKNGMSLTSLRDKLSSIWTTAKTWWDKKKEKLSTYTPSIGDVKSKLSTAWSTAKTWWDKTKSGLGTYTPNIGNIKDKVSSAWTTARNWWSNSKSALSTYTPSIGNIKDKVSSAWTTARNWWTKSKSAMSTYTPNIGSIKDKLSSAWTTAKNWWNNNVRLSIPSLSFKVTYTPKSSLGVVKKAIVNALGLDGWPKLSFAANGGMFDMGSLIWAGEAGAEIVANAPGGKTGVMNVDQMQNAVYEGVYSAVVAAMRANSGNGGSQSVHVFLDGREITASVEQRQNERGVGIMGNQVRAY